MSVASREPVFPYGYARPPTGGAQGLGTLLTWQQMMTKKTVYNLHPEVQRRLHALLLFAYQVGVPLGVGTGWRVQPPSKPGFAKPGNSWHESCPVNPASPSAYAIDTVPNISWDWLEKRCGNFGFRTFRNVNNEPWHIQPSEIPAARKYASTPPKLYKWDLPGTVKPTPQPPPQEEDDMTADQARQLNDLWNTHVKAMPGNTDPNGTEMNSAWTAVYGYRVGKDLQQMIVALGNRIGAIEDKLGIPN